MSQTARVQWQTHTRKLLHSRVACAVWIQRENKTAQRAWADGEVCGDGIAGIGENVAAIIAGWIVIGFGSIRACVGVVDGEKRGEIGEGGELWGNKG
jgi:hypothetical protein